MVTENSIGQMDSSIKEAGRLKDQVKVCFIIPLEQFLTEFGVVTREKVKGYSILMEILRDKAL